MHLNNKSLAIIVVVLIGAFSACSTDAIEEPEPKEPQTLENLDGVFIKTIASTEEGLLFGTETGIYKKTEDGYLEYGLQEEEVVDIADLGEGEYMAVTRYKDDSANTDFLYKKSDESWMPYMGNYAEGLETYNSVQALAVDKRVPGKMIAISGSSIVRTSDGGDTWESVHSGWDTIGDGRFVAFSQHDTNTVWAGGMYGSSQPILFKSKNGGETWARIESIQLEEGWDSGYCYDLIINPADTNEVMVGMWGKPDEYNGIKKSSDEGLRWEQVYSDAPIYTFTHSVRDPNTIYASGKNQEGELFFIYTTNFGDSWQTVNIDTDPGGLTVTDLVSVLEDEKEVLYFATNKGVYTYKVDG